jgi:hypothetical protein
MANPLPDHEHTDAAYIACTTAMNNTGLRASSLKLLYDDVGDTPDGLPCIMKSIGCIPAI